MGYFQPPHARQRIPPNPRCSPVGSAFAVAPGGCPQRARGAQWSLPVAGGQCGARSAPSNRRAPSHSEQVGPLPQRCPTQSSQCATNSGGHPVGAHRTLSLHRSGRVAHRVRSVEYQAGIAQAGWPLCGQGGRIPPPVLTTRTSDDESSESESRRRSRSQRRREEQEAVGEDDHGVGAAESMVRQSECGDGDADGVKLTRVGDEQ